MLSGTSSSAEPCASAIQNEKGMCARCDGFSDLGEMRAHGLCVGMWHDQSGRFSPFRADGAENVAPDIAGVARGTGACSTLGPDTGERALLANPRFILKPYLQGLAAGCFRQGCFYLCGEVFLKASCASGSDFGCCGRADRRRKPRLANCLPTVRSCMVAEALFDLAFQISAASAQPHRRGRDPPEPFPPTPPSVPRSRQGIRRATVEQARHALRIVTVGPIPQRLPIHAAVFCRRLAVNPIQNQGTPTSGAAFPSRHRAARRSSPADLSRVILTAKSLPP